MAAPLDYKYPTPRWRQRFMSQAFGRLKGNFLDCLRLYALLNLMWLLLVALAIGGIYLISLF